MNSFLDLLKDKAIDLGATRIGFSDIKDAVPKEFEHLPYGISIIVRLSDQIVNQIEKAPTFTYFHHYRDVNVLIDQICLRLSLLIQEQGYLAMNVPASQTVNAQDQKYRAVFSHKTAAVLAGMGWIGKNDLFVTEEFGSRIRLGTILTNMPVPFNEKISESMCGNCNLCVKACPANAIQGNNWTLGMEREQLVDPNLCNQHMKNAYKEIGRGSVCGLCMRVCPKGSKILKK